MKKETIIKLTIFSLILLIWLIMWYFWSFICLIIILKRLPLYFNEIFNYFFQNFSILMHIFTSLILSGITLSYYYQHHKHNKTTNNSQFLTSEKEFKNIDKQNLINFNKKVGLVKSKLNQHTLLIGATGSGKTTTALSIINQLVYKLNQTVIIIDGKGDNALIEQIKLLDNNSFIWNFNGDNQYNPFASNNHIVLADKIMSLFDFTEPHYQAIAHCYTLLLIKSLLKNNIFPTLENIVNYFPLSKMEKIIDTNNKDDFLVFSNFKANDIKGLYYRLSSYNEQLKQNIGLENNLSQLTANHKIILFSLNSLSYPQLASNMAKLLIQDLKEFANTKPRDQYINLVLDEFNVFASDSVINLINKTRSFNYQCFLCFQVTDDLSTDKKKLLNTIFGNVGNIIAHNITDVDSPEYIAKVFGTRTTEKITKQYDINNKSSSKGSIREVEEYVVHPNDLKRLKSGQAYCKILLPSSNYYINKINIIKSDDLEKSS